MAKFTPLYSAKPVSIRDTLSGQFIKSGPSKTADVLVGVSKRRPMNEHELYVRNKVAQYGGATTAALGLTALGTRGAAGAMRLAPKAAKGLQATGRLGPRAEPTLTRLVASKKPLKVKAKRLERTSNTLGTVGFGTGSITGINSSQLAGDNARRHRLAKNYGGTMDFGLGGVQQGVEISKKQDWQNIEEHKRRARDSRRSRDRALNVAGMGGLAIGTAASHAQMTGAPSWHQQTANAASHVKHYGQSLAANRKLPAERRAAARAANYRLLKTGLSANKHGGVVLGGAALMAGGGAVAAGYRANEKRHDVAIARQRKARAVRKSFTPLDEVSKLGPAKVRYQGLATASNDTNRVDQNDTLDVHYKGKSMILRRPKYQVVAYNGGAMKNPGTRHLVGVTPNMKANKLGRETVHGFYQSGKKTQKHHDTNGTNWNYVRKAYDPERKRQNRLRTYGDAGFAAAGATGVAAVAQGRKAVSHGRKYAGTSQALRVNPQLLGGVRDTRAMLEVAQSSHGHGVAALKHGGKAAGLGIGAAGIALGSHRIRQYSKGRGGSYKPMRSIEY